MYIVFDIGGTKMRLAASRDGEHFGEPKIIPTPKKFEEGIEQFTKLARELSGGENIVALAGGIAGPIDRKKGCLVNSPHISGWIGKPLTVELTKHLAAPVYLENDTAIVGLGEAVAGAGMGHGIVVYITVSTGMGGARLVDGKIDESKMGFEPGHQIVNFDGSARYLEECISGSALEKRHGKKPYEISDPAVWEEEAELLAYGLNNATVFWSPDVIVLGGSMVTGNPAIPLDRVAHHLKKTLKIFPESPPLKKAALGDIGGLHGALAFLKQNLN